MFATEPTRIQTLIEQMTPEIYQALKRSVELGKWSHGDQLTDEQKQLSLQAVIAYEQRHLPEAERSGYIPPREHTHCGSRQGEIVDDPVQPLHIR